MNILNFAHPLTSKQISSLEELIRESISTNQHIPVQFDTEHPFVPQIHTLLESLGIPPERWQTEDWLIVLPSLNYITALLVTELHGRLGHFPSIVRLKPTHHSATTEFEVAEIINLQQVRDTARHTRQQTGSNGGRV